MRIIEIEGEVKDGFRFGYNFLTNLELKCNFQNTTVFQNLLLLSIAWRENANSEVLSPTFAQCY